MADEKTALAEKKISARELTSEFYKRIEARNPELNAFLTLSPERAYATSRQNRRADRRRASRCLPWPACPSP